MSNNTIFLRLEAPLQAWGGRSRLVIRNTDDQPSKSGIVGLICCAMGLDRTAAVQHLPRLNALAMGVRVDRPGVRWADYHTAGAGYGLRTAEGKIKRTQSTGELETLVSRRYFLCDASFLVALQGDGTTIASIADALRQPRWPIFLGRKSCPPAVPVLDSVAEHENLVAALSSRPWSSRLANLDVPPASGTVPAMIECVGSPLPDRAELQHDVLVSLKPPVHEPRYVVRQPIEVAVGKPTCSRLPLPRRPQADYTNTHWRRMRTERLEHDQGLCVFCKQPGGTVQHITYRHAGGGERLEELATLCRLCHDAVSMIEYGLEMGIDRIDPTDPNWRDQIIDRRNEIIRFRSQATRRRHLAAEEVD